MRCRQILSMDFGWDVRNSASWEVDWGGKCCCSIHPIVVIWYYYRRQSSVKMTYLVDVLSRHLRVGLNRGRLSGAVFHCLGYPVALMVITSSIIAKGNLGPCPSSFRCRLPYISALRLPQTNPLSEIRNPSGVPYLRYIFRFLLSERNSFQDSP